MRMTGLLTVAGCFLGLLAGIVFADPKSDYEMLFGEEAKKVSATKQTTDDAALAEKILKAAIGMIDAPRTRVFLFEKVVEFGRRDPRGAPHALKAIDLLIESQPSQQAKWWGMKYPILEMQFRRSSASARKEAAKPYIDALIKTAEAKILAGDTEAARALYRKSLGVANYAGYRVSDIQDRIRSLLFAVQVEAEQKKLVEKLAANPGDLETREKLILLYVTEVDSPPKAAKLLTKSVGDKLRLRVLAATKDLSDVSEIDCLTLGDWYYQSILPQASAAAKAKVLLRARNYHDRYLTLHRKNDIIRVKVKMQLAKINAAIEKITPVAKPKVDPNEKPLDYNKLELAKLTTFLEGTWKCTQTLPQGSCFWGFERGKGVHYQSVNGKVKYVFFSGTVYVTKDKKRFDSCNRGFSIVDKNRVRRHGAPGDMVRVNDSIAAEVKIQLAKIDAAIEKVDPNGKPLDYNKLDLAKLAAFLEGTWKCTQALTNMQGSYFWRFERGKGVHYLSVNGKVEREFFSGAVSVTKDKKRFGCCMRAFSIVDRNRVRRHNARGDIMVRVKK